MQTPDGTYWATDPALVSTLTGGKSVIDWFGFAPSFHDATLVGLDIGSGSVTIRIEAFRITSEVDANGYYVLDKHAVVTLSMHRVSGISLTGDAQSIISALRIRRLEADAAGWRTCEGPKAGHFEVSFESVYGLEGSIFADEISFDLTPIEIST